MKVSQGNMLSKFKLKTINSLHPLVSRENSAEILDGRKKRTLVQKSKGIVL